MIIQFTNEEMTEVRRVACARNGCKEEHQNRRKAYEKDEELHVVGAMGELAIEKILGPGLDRRVLKHGDDGIDAVYHGTTIQIKSRLRDYDSCDLFLQEKDECKADILILVARLSHNKVIIKGWIPTSEFLFLHRVKSYPGHTSINRYVTQDFLFPIKHLIKDI